jgi:hypothetical protein
MRTIVMVEETPVFLSFSSVFITYAVKLTEMVHTRNFHLFHSPNKKYNTYID